jgi:hypothetical protein
MKWRPFRSGVPYTCQDCPAYAELEADRDKWREIAGNFARAFTPTELGFAQLKYNEAVQND